jgi:type I restriction enzyme S subunit
MPLSKMQPKLRFPQFSNNWAAKRIDEVTEKVSIPVKVNKSELYQQIGIRSHGKGLFHKELVTGETLGNKRVFWVKENVFVVNIVFAWEQAVAKTTSAEIGMIASHRFPMFKPLENILDLDFLLTLFLTKRGKALLELASPGGAGRNKTLGQSEFAKLKINIPTLSEQQKIAAFLTAVDEKIKQLTKKKDLLEQYKKGVMQQIFNQEIRFKDDSGNDFADWEEKKISEVATCLDNKRVPLNQAQREKMKGSIPYWGANNVMDYINDFLFDEPLVLLAEDGGYFDEYQTRPIANFAIGKCWVNNHAHILRAKENVLTEFLYFSLVHKNILAYVNAGTRSKLNKSDMLLIKLKLPSVPEQQKIANFLSAIDDKIHLVNQQLEKTQTFKKSLLQQMFV